MKLRIATRKSRLALTQSRWVADRIRAHAPDLEIEEVHVVTQGDRVTDRPLQAVGGKALFVAEVEAAIVEGRADIAVHSLKDVPGDTELAEGLDILCVPPREDPRDVLVTLDGADLDDLEAGARIGTTSLRRVCQLRRRRPDLEYATLRGNVDTRLRKLEEGKYRGIVLAAAGLQRLGMLEGLKHVVLSTELCLPAVGQGTLAIEGRITDAQIRDLLAPLEHVRTRFETEAERAFLKRLRGTCHVPIAGSARLSAGGERLELEGLVGSLDGQQMISAAGDRYLRNRSHEEDRAAARALGEEVADGLIARGARKLMSEAEASMQRTMHSGNGSGSH